jgi:hypothetical protein
MMEDWAGGRLPKPDLDNIAVYQELCATMDVEAVGALDDAGYAAAYRARVSERDSAWPIPPDRRFARAAPGG